MSPFFIHGKRLIDGIDKGGVMRVALLLKDGSICKDLSSGLRDKGLDAAAYEFGDAGDLKTYMAISRFFAHEAEGFDLVHNCMGAHVLIFSRFISTPLLTTIEKSPSEEEGMLYRSLGRYYAPVSGGLVIEGADCTVITPGQMGFVDAYIALYEKIISANAREDHRPWGYYEVLSDDKNDHKVKRITVWPGKRLSLQLHKKRREHWVIISGKARVTLGKDTFTLGPSQSVDIPVETAHRIENIGNIPLVFIEVQQGDYFGEDDIIRLEDDYGRV